MWQCSSASFIAAPRWQVLHAMLSPDASPTVPHGAIEKDPMQYAVFVTLNTHHQRSAGPALAGPGAPSTEVQEGCTEKKRTKLVEIARTASQV